MAITTVLFDLDGTLLPMDLEIFIQAYFGKIAARMASYGYEPKKLIESIWRGTGAMVKNNGSKTNEEAFWEVVATVYGDSVLNDKHLFDEFYIEEFGTLSSVCGYEPTAAKIISDLKDKGYRIVLATNPIFPALATEWRINWAGLNIEDFELVTTYENSRYCKPNPDYYRDILQHIQVPAEACLMVGNDVTEDMIASKLGMQVFLLTNCLINKNNEDIAQYQNGGFEALSAYLKQLPKLN